MNAYNELVWISRNAFSLVCIHAVWMGLERETLVYTQYAHIVSQQWMYHVTHMNESCHAYEWITSRIWRRHVTREALVPQTEEIELQIITTVQISNKFPWESPYISNTFARESPNFHTSFHVYKRSPRHSKDVTRKSLDLGIQIF